MTWQQTEQEDKRLDGRTAEHSKTRESKSKNIKMRRRLYTSNYTGIPAYLMDFGFGGFLGYGRRVSCCVGEEELKMYEG